MIDLDNVFATFCQAAELRMTETGRIGAAYIVVGRTGRSIEINESNVENRQAALRVAAVASIALDATAIIQVGEAKVSPQRIAKTATARKPFDCLMVVQVEMRNGEPFIRQHLREIVRARDGTFLEMKPPIVGGEQRRAAIADYLPRTPPEPETQALAGKLLSVLGEYGAPTTIH